MGIDAGTSKGAERGTGNIVSAEFNLAYRWHSCISSKNDAWIQNFYHDLFGKPATDVTTQDMIMGFLSSTNPFLRTRLSASLAAFRGARTANSTTTNLLLALVRPLAPSVLRFGLLTIISQVSAARDPTHFLDPATVNPRRPLRRWPTRLFGPGRQPGSTYGNIPSTVPAEECPTRARSAGGAEEGSPSRRVRRVPAGGLGFTVPLPSHHEDHVR